MPTDPKPALSRRSFLRASGAAVAAATLLKAKADSGTPAKAAVSTSDASQTLYIGSRLELFVDDALVGRLEGKADRRVNHPVPQEVSLFHNQPWEGGGSGYHSIFKDGDRYRMYYRGWGLDGEDPKLGSNEPVSPRRLCYAESDDGIAWRRPELGLYDFNGSKANNIIIPENYPGFEKLSVGETAVFKDSNPNVPEDERYKTLTACHKPYGLVSFKSADGIHWTPLATQPLITNGSFDSQNLAFWDELRGEYRAYWRYFTKGTTNAKTWKAEGTRAIRTGTSKDFRHWTAGENLRYVDSPEEQLYTNQVKPYYRAPHLLIGFPTRYVDRGWSDSMRALPDLKPREARARANTRYGTAVSEALVMAGRDGVTFKRWNEAFLRAGIERRGTWNYGHQYIGWQMVETKSPLDGGAANEISLYATENYWNHEGTRLRRYSLRIDGFVSVSAPMAGGEFVTKPLVFSGDTLAMNFSTSAAGGVRIEIQTPDGQPIPGYTLADCPSHFGDSLARTVAWNQGPSVARLQDRPVRLRFVLNDADLYSIQFKA